MIPKLLGIESSLSTASRSCTSGSGELRSHLNSVAGTATSAYDLAIDAVERLKQIEVEFARAQTDQPSLIQCGLSHTEAPTARLIDLAAAELPVAPAPRERDLVPKVLETSWTFSVPPQGLSSPKRDLCPSDGPGLISMDSSPGARELESLSTL